MPGPSGGRFSSPVILTAAAHSRRRVRVHQAELLAVTDQLLHEHEDMSVGAVVAAVRDARTEFRMAGLVFPPPQLVGARARGALRSY